MGSKTPSPSSARGLEQIRRETSPLFLLFQIIFHLRDSICFLNSGGGGKNRAICRTREAIKREKQKDRARSDMRRDVKVAATACIFANTSAQTVVDMLIPLDEKGTPKWITVSFAETTLNGRTVAFADPIGKTNDFSLLNLEFEALAKSCSSWEIEAGVVESERRSTVSSAYKVILERPLASLTSG